MTRWKSAMENGQPSQYAIVRGNQSIARVYVMGCTLYELYVGNDLIGSFDGPDDARAKADELLALERKAKKEVTA